jgi:hypothetical protein
MISETNAKSVGSVSGLEGDPYEMEEIPKKVYKFCEVKFLSLDNIKIYL